jgi:O-antigen/teichoic acid export membrane protein
MAKLPELNFELLSGAFIYSMSGFLNALVSFLLLPLLTRYLSPFDYGIIETFTVVVTLLTGVIVAGGNTLLTKEYFNLDAAGRRSFTENTLGFVLASGSLLLVLFVVFGLAGNLLQGLLKIDNGLIFWIIVVALSNAVISVVLTLLQLERKSKRFALFVNSLSFSDIAISLFLVIVLRMGWMGRISGIIASSLIFFGVALFFFRKRAIAVKMPERYFTTLVFIAPPFILAHTSGWINEMVDRVMINNMLGVDSTGLYAIGSRFGMVIMLIHEALNKVWFPFFYENIKENTPAHDRRIVRNTYLYAGGLLIFSLVYGIFGKQLLYLVVDKRFYAAGNFVFLLSMGYCFYGIWKIFIGYLIYKGRIKTYSAIVVFVSILNIALNYFLLKRIGLIGSAWAAFVSFGAGAVLTVIFAVRSHPMPWALTRGAQR